MPPLPTVRVPPTTMFDFTSLAVTSDPELIVIFPLVARLPERVVVPV